MKRVRHEKYAFSPRIVYHGIPLSRSTPSPYKWLRFRNKNSRIAGLSERFLRVPSEPRSRVPRDGRVTRSSINRERKANLVRARASQAERFRNFRLQLTATDRKEQGGEKKSDICQVSRWRLSPAMMRRLLMIARAISRKRAPRLRGNFRSGKFS